MPCHATCPAMAFRADHPPHRAGVLGGSSAQASFPAAQARL